MQITHAEAHNLIQLNLDRALNTEKQRLLSTHLQECKTCRAYADRMVNVETMLRQMMNKQWDQPPLPLSLDSLRSQNFIQKRANSLFGLRTVLASTILVAFAFFMWQLTTTVYRSSEQFPSSVLPVPTPSSQFGTASLESSQCEWSLHKVETFDTLESIAFQYSVSKEEIMTFNSMTSELVYESMELKIPQCNVTPTKTAHMPTTTLTPILELTIDTPG